MTTTLMVNDLTFGIEIETHVPMSSPHRPTGYRRGDRVSLAPSFNGVDWTMTSDSSIYAPSVRADCEFVSPILKGAEGLENALACVRSFRAECEDGGYGAKVNSSCGVHVHVQFPTNDLKVLRRLVHLVAAFEGGLYASTGTKSRETGTWCRPIKSSHKNLDWNAETHLDLRSKNPALGHRYVNLNLIPFLNGTRPTVEFRLFSGSLNETKIAAFVQICLGMVEQSLAMKSSAHWESGDAGIAYGKDCGQGEREINRLLKRLGWSGLMNKRSTPNRGILTPSDGLPTKRQMVKKLREMSRKYDA